jgi:hypothetical protein
MTMSKRKPTTANGAPGIKLLLTAAAIAATLAGWAGLAGQAEQQTPTPVEIAAPAAPSDGLRSVTQHDESPAVRAVERPTPVTVTQSSR